MCIFFTSNIHKYNSNPHPLAVTTVLLLINNQHFSQIINEIEAWKSIHSPKSMSCKQILICCLFYSTKRSLCTHNWVATSDRFKLLVKNGHFCLNLCMLQRRLECDRVGPTGRTVRRPARVWSEQEHGNISFSKHAHMETITYLPKQTAAQVTPSCLRLGTSHCYGLMNNVLKAQWQGLWTPICQTGNEQRSHR